MKLRRRHTSFVFCWAMLLAWFAGCGTLLAGLAQERGADSRASIHASADPGPWRIRYAKGFTLAYRDSCKILTVFDPGRGPDSKPMDTFVLVPRGRRPPNLQGTVIEIPVRRVALRSGTHAPFFSLLGAADRIAAITQGRYVNDPEVAARISQGRITEVGVGSGMTAQFDAEKLLSLHPDVVMSWWTSNPAYAGHLKAKEAGLPVVLLADYEENTLLGRAEWIKFVAAFLDAEAKAESCFSGIERRYLAMAAKAKAVSFRPTVMYGSSFGGSWYVAGGKSAFANLVKDAGGTYLWEDDETTGAKPINAETALIRGKRADFWFTQKLNQFSLADLAAEDSRYRLFKAFGAGQVYSNNGKIGPGGGNDYYQGTMVRPDLLIADMIAILHPELLPHHKLIWHNRLTAEMAGGRGKRK